MFCIHVDDFAIASTNPRLTAELVSLLRQKYVVTESDSLESFLGVHIESTNSSLYLSQPGLLSKVIHAADVQDCSPKDTPMATTYDELDQATSALCGNTLFRKLLGMVMFLLRTRPDIAYAVNRLATRTSHATMQDMIALK